MARAARIEQQLRREVRARRAAQAQLEAVRESQHETSRIMMPQDANNLGHVFGGVILGMMDTTAAVCAIRHARATCVTASIDRVDFREPIFLGDLVIMKASLNDAGRSSMEVGVRVVVEVEVAVAVDVGVFVTAAGVIT